MTQYYRNTWAEIDLDAVDTNVKQIKQKLPEHTQIMAVVKANGYGHGAVQVAQQALESGATALGVALLEEGLSLRQAGIQAPILVFGWVSPEYGPIAAEHDLTLTVFQKEWLESVPHGDFQHPLNIHLKWDSGMGRIGMQTTEELHEIMDVLRRKNNIHLTGAYTHFATADEADLTFYHTQEERFSRFVTHLKALWPDPITIHSSNSAASIRFPDKSDHYIRFGIALYGLYPSAFVKEKQCIHLEQAFSLHSRLIHVKQIQAGDTVSYGREFTAEKSEWIGTIPIGYGDGWTRRLQGTSVLVDGRKCPIVGRICMDRTMILLDKPYAIGTKVTLIGKQQNSYISMDDLAQYLGTINYEIPCMINERVPRIYERKRHKVN